MKLSEFFQEDNGNLSSMRLLTAFIVVAVIGTWAVVSLRTNAVASLDWQAVGAVIGAMAAKAWQKEKEHALPA
jgi:hypothetical protein